MESRHHPISSWSYRVIPSPNGGIDMAPLNLTLRRGTGEALCSKRKRVFSGAAFATSRHMSL